VGVDAGGGPPQQCVELKSASGVVAGRDDE